MGIKLQRNKLSHRHTHTHTHGAEHQKNTENAIEVKSTRKISGKNQKTNGHSIVWAGRGGGAAGGGGMGMQVG